MSMKNDKMWTAISLCFFLMLNINYTLSEQEKALEKDHAEDLSGDTIDRQNIQGSFWRTVRYEDLNDPKKEFFSRIELPDDIVRSSLEGKLSDRNRRQIDEENIDAGTVIINTDIAKEISTQQQEVSTQETLKVSTESIPPTTAIRMEDNHAKTNFIPINDFIRFRRELIQEAHEDTENGENESKSRSQRFDLENENFDVQNNRGPRGLSTQEWVKFPYPVQRTQKSEDSFATSSVFNKPRRVHFITQKQFAVDNPSIGSSNSRQGRVDDQPTLSRDQSRVEKIEMDVRRGKEMFIPRNFDGPIEYPYRFPRGRYYERDLVEQRPDSRSLGIYPRNRDRRIIYYANLPEITRNPPRFREMGRFKDPVEESYFGSKHQRAFYRDPRNEELQHPMIVSADINVRDVTKNPEKRIYSDVKRKYHYDSPYFDEDQSTRIRRN
ncbi:uncharacterized protein LOC123321775 isoform X2 [Coccinella septempunctata]|uniref:uncharacterized protein LOC123321775 isoform X2 n=1 Tax=Coccinella septempunctata TaxID=41139 RepID=UPI001D08A956|nr:uncharacterized protein LOC123321775 isoform X2 [Coccinella septempunctata]